MNGVHDMGGTIGYGRVPALERLIVERDVVFEADLTRRMAEFVSMEHDEVY